MLYINSTINKVLTLSMMMMSLFACASPPSNDYNNETLPERVVVVTPPITPKFQRDYNRALTFIKNKKNRSAIRALMKLTQNYPQFAGPHVNLGLIFFKAKQYSKARNAFNKALTLNPNNAVSHNHVGIMQRKKGDFKDALKSYRLALLENPNYANAHLNIGILYDIYFSDLPNALSHYQRYLEITGDKDKRVKNWIIDIKRRVKAL